MIERQIMMVRWKNGEGDGTPLQYSCLEIPMDGAAWLGSLRVRHDWTTSLSRFTFMHWRKKWQPTPVFLPGESWRWRSLAGCSPWDRWGLDMTEWLHFHFSLSCIGEGNGNPHFSVLAWRILGMAEPGGLPSMESHRVGHDWSDLAAAADGRINVC